MAEVPYEAMQEPTIEQPKAPNETVAFNDFGDSMPPPYNMPMANPVAHQANVTVIQNQPAPTTSVVQIFQTSVNFPRGIPRDWSTPLCGCFEDCQGCMAGFFCFSCYECHVASKMGEACFTPMCVPRATLVMRAHFRARHNIQGTLLNDCCISSYCPCCALTQISREFDNMEKGMAAP